MNPGDKILKFKNPENINSAYIIECSDVCEVSPTETYYELSIKPLRHDDNIRGKRRYKIKKS